VTDPLYQRGANGLVAEHECARELNQLLTAAGITCLTPQQDLEHVKAAAVARVASELSPQQLQRGINQGAALGRFIAKALSDDPAALALTLPGPLAELDVGVTHVGYLTNARDSADIALTFVQDGAEVAFLPISLKAYRGTLSSLGSKSARASLTRVFLSKEKVADAAFVSYFGDPGARFLASLADFKAVAEYFYRSAPEGKEFLDAYEARKGTRRVDNKLRRKELGYYYSAQRGFKSEHVFAEQYVEMFSSGISRIDSEQAWDQFLVGMRFVLGMDQDVTTLNALARDDGRVYRIVNSVVDGAYADVRRVLVSGCTFLLTHRPGSGNIGVEVAHDGLQVKCLQLAIWKDATIQFKLDTVVR
jgi:hypothetical protein